MPKIFEWNGYKFFFFSNEGYPREPLHVHVRKGSNIAKLWLDPEIQLANSYGFTAPEINTLESIIVEHSEEIRRK